MPDSLPPNVPRPANGPVKNFDNAERTFSRPYSAKTIFFYKIGDEHFRGVRLPVSKARYRTMEALLDDLNEKVPMQFGVRRLFTPRGRAEVTNLDDLQHMGRYVCSSSKWAARRYAAVADKYADKYGSGSEHSSIHSASEQQASLHKAATASKRFTSPKGFSMDKNIKQITFLLNGMPNKSCRIQIKSNRYKLTFEDVLIYISESLQVPISKLFTTDGTRVFTIEDLINNPSPFVACQRHEKLISLTSTESNVKLPIIKSNNNLRSTARSKLLKSSKLIEEKITLPPLSPTRKRIKKQLRARTVSKKRQPHLNSIDESQPNVAQDLSSEVIDPELNASVIKIQSSVRGYLARKLVRDLRDENEERLNDGKSEQGLELRNESLNKAKHFEQNHVNAKKSESLRRNSMNEESRIDRRKFNKSTTQIHVGESTKNASFKYTVSVFTGNRWAAETEADLYITLVGELNQTDKLWLRQQGEEPKFLQNQVDTFEVQTNINAGPLRKIICGHEAEGYGAGVFIERIVISENKDDRVFQYVFLCSKWFDSGQVDGKLERTIPCTGYYLLNSKPVQVEKSDDDFFNDDADQQKEVCVSSKSRYRITVRCGKVMADNQQDTSVNIVCYGSQGNSDPYCVWPNLSVKDAKTSMTFDLDCGNIGELYKVRFESDNPSVSWQLDTVVIRDVDTGEESCLNCNKWLCKTAPPNVKLIYMQTFRELPVIRIGLEPLPVYQYVIYVKLSEDFRFVKSPCQVHIQMRGEFGDSGTHTVLITPLDNNNMSDSTSEYGLDCRIVLEAVSLGRLAEVTFEIPVEESAVWIAKGYETLNALYSKYDLPNVTAQSGHSWIIDQVNVRESTHAPYLFMLKEFKYFSCDKVDFIRKIFLFSDMQGLSTKLKEKLLPKDRQKTATKQKRDGKWMVTVITGQSPEAGTENTLFLVVYGERGVSPPIALLDKDQTLLSGSTCYFQVELDDIGRIFKIRLRLDFQKDQKSMWYLRRIKMKELATGDELRFPVEMWLERTDDNPDVAIELPAVWPDVPPIPSLTYQVKLKTGLDSANDTNFDVSLIVYGDKGDSGRRFLISAVGTDSDSCFKPGNIDTFEFEAVSVGKIEKILLSLEPKAESASWFLDQVEIFDSGNDLLYTFVCEKLFTDKGDQLEFEVSPTLAVSYDAL